MSEDTLAALADDAAAAADAFPADAAAEDAAELAAALTPAICNMSAVFGMKVVIPSALVWCGDANPPVRAIPTPNVNTPNTVTIPVVTGRFVKKSLVFLVVILLILSF